MGCDVAAKQNVTLASAEKICGALDACIGFTFRSSTATPVGIVQNVYFKGVNPGCGYSRFGDGICPSGDGTVWQVRRCRAALIIRMLPCVPARPPLRTRSCG